MTYYPTLADRQREAEMKRLLAQIDDPTTTPETKSSAWVKYQGLHTQRPAEFVADFERRLGLIRDASVTSS